MMKSQRCKSCACWDCGSGVDICKCETRRSEGLEPPSPPLPPAREQPYALVQPLAAQDDAVTEHKTDNSKDTMAALRLIDKDTDREMALQWKMRYSTDNQIRLACDTITQKAEQASARYKAQARYA